MVCPAGQIANMAVAHHVHGVISRILVVTPVHAGLTTDSDFMIAYVDIVYHPASLRPKQLIVQCNEAFARKCLIFVEIEFYVYSMSSTLELLELTTCQVE